MGTRNLTMVVLNGETKIAQYGQWDGYPNGQGLTILNLLKTFDLSIFRKKVAMLRWLTDKECDQLNETDWKKQHPYLSRDVGGKIIGIVYDGKLCNTTLEKTTIELDIKILGLINEESFAKNSAFCEWGYVIDLDNNAFEVYKGLNKSPLTETDRFYGPSQYGYYPIKEIARFDLNNLPSDEVFLNQTQHIKL